MQWLNEPASWQRTGDVLRVSVDPCTDFWRTTDRAVVLGVLGRLAETGS